MALKGNSTGTEQTLLPPGVKLFGSIVRWNELMQKSQVVWVAKWTRTQEQRIDHAEHAGVRSNSKGKRGGCQSSHRGPLRKSGKSTR